MGNNKLRIAHILGNCSLGGVSVCVYNYIKELDLNRFSFDFYLYGESHIREKLSKLGNVYELPSFVNFPKATNIFNNYLKSKQYDIVHCHLSSLSFFALKVAKKRGVPLRICHAHSATDNKEKRALAKNILKKLSTSTATHYISCSELSGKWLFGKEWKNVFLLRNAVDPIKFSFATETREKLRSHYSINGFCIGFFGRLEYQKNLHFLLRVFHDLTKQRDATLVIMGDGSDMPSLKKFVEDTNLTGKVLFLKPTDRPESFYNMLDLFCLPSRYEGLPMVAVEATANGLPILVSNVVTTEANFAGNMTYLPLVEDSWVQTLITRIDSPIARLDYCNVLKTNGYDITQERLNLANYYEDIFSKSHNKQSTEAKQV